MKNIFDPATQDEIQRRIKALSLESKRQWGKMDAAQALAHCSIWMEVVAGERITPKMPLGRVIGLMVKPLILRDDKPMRRNSPTAKGMIVRADCDLESEKARLSGWVAYFASSGPAGCTQNPHAFFGRLKPGEWAILMYKHLDHHLRQFGV